MDWIPTALNLTGPPGPAGVLLPSTLLLLSPTGGTKVPILRAAADLTVVRVDALVSGSTPSLNLSLRVGADFSAGGTELVSGGITVESTSTGEVVTSFAVDAVPAGSWLWLVTTSLSGTVDALHVSVHLEPAAAA